MTVRQTRPVIYRQAWRRHLHELAHGVRNPQGDLIVPPWQQGQHMTFIAPTQSGKTVMARQVTDIMANRGVHCITFATKNRDASLDAYLANGWTKVRGVKDIRPTDRKVIIWPKGDQTRKATQDRQREVFDQAFDWIIQDGSWTVLMDETYYLADREFLGLDGHIKYLHHMGASDDLTAITLLQRPAWVPKIIYSSCTHAYLGMTEDRDDIRSLSHVGGRTNLIKQVVPELPSMHDFVHAAPKLGIQPVVVNTRK